MKVKTSKGNGKMEILDAMGERNANWNQIEGKIFVKGKKVESFGVANADGYNKNDDHYNDKINIYFKIFIIVFIIIIIRNENK